MINAILAFNRTLADRTDSEGNTVKPEQWLPQDYGGSWARAAWREPVIATKQRTVFDVLLSDEATLNQIEADYPDLIVAGSWDHATGAKNRAIHTKAINIVPDVVERDQDGNETSRSRATIKRSAHTWAGQAERDWS